MNLYIIIDNATLDLVKFYYKDSNGKFSMKISGDIIPFKKREIEDRRHVFNINLEANSKETYYMYVETEGAAQFPVKILSEKNFYNNSIIDYSILCLYCGLIICVFFYNILVFILIRESIIQYLKSMSKFLLLVEL